MRLIKEKAGGLRRTDKPANRMGDIMGAADFIRNDHSVDLERVGVFGICSGEDSFHYP